MGRVCGSGGAGRGRRQGAGKGRGPRGRAALPALLRAPRPRLPTDALAAARGCRAPCPGGSWIPQGGGSGREALERSGRTAPPGSRAQRWVFQPGARQPGHHFHGAYPWCWGLMHGEKVAPERLEEWGVLGSTEDFKWHLAPLPSGAVLVEGLPRKG